LLFVIYYLLFIIHYLLFIIYYSLFSNDEFIHYLAATRRIRRSSIFGIQIKTDSLENFKRSYSTVTTIYRSADLILRTTEESSEKEESKEEELNENVPDVLYFDAPRGRLNERIDISKIHPDNHSRSTQYHPQQSW
jgi:hypothetical protein